MFAEIVMIDFDVTKGFVKICGVTSADDARMVVSSGADALGLNFAISKRHVESETARDVVEATPGFMHVGVFRDSDSAFVLETVSSSGVNVAQIHGLLSNDLTERLHERDIRVIKALSVNESDFLDFDDGLVDAVLVDGAEPGSGVGYSRSLVTRREFRAPLIIAGGLNTNNVASVIDEIGPWGVDVATGVEASPRVKDPILVSKFVTLAREAFKREENM